MVKYQQYLAFAPELNLTGNIKNGKGLREHFHKWETGAGTQEQPAQGWRAIALGCPQSVPSLLNVTLSSRRTFVKKQVQPLVSQMERLGDSGVSSPNSQAITIHWGLWKTGRAVMGVGAGPGQGPDVHLFHITSCCDMVVFHHHQPAQVVAMRGSSAYKEPILLYQPEAWCGLPGACHMPSPASRPGSLYSCSSTAGDSTAPGQHVQGHPLPQQ